MRLKTYFASSVEAAILLALEQMGPEAMIVNSRKAALENRHLGEYEVVFAVAPEDEPALDPTRAQATGRTEASEPAGIEDGTSGDPATDPVRRLHGEVSRLAAEIESLGRVVKRTDAKHGISGFEGEQADLANCLTEAGFSDEFVLETIKGTAVDGGSLRFRVLQVLTERLKTSPSLGRTGHGRKVAALVGPAGAGKSALVAKLATRFGVAARRPCQILSIDSDRIGAVEPLRMVAAVLGVGFRLLERTADLVPALESLRDRDLVLIDTPGFARDEAEVIERLAQLLAGRPEIDVQLVLPATMKMRDLERTIQYYRVLRPQRLMFTRLDETDQIGTLIEVAVRTGLPVSFLSSGPRIPEDLEPANASQLARRVFLPGSGGFVRRAAA